MFKINFLKKTLFVILVISFALAIFFSFLEENIFFKRQILELSNFLEVPSEQFLGLKRDTSLSRDEIERFLRKVEQQQIFASVYIEENLSMPGVDKEKISKIIENLRLVGILQEEPQEVIIEDEKTGRSFRLKAGGEFLESIKVEKIKKDSVILNCYEEIFELYL